MNYPEVDLLYARCCLTFSAFKQREELDFPQNALLCVSSLTIRAKLQEKLDSVRTQYEFILNEVYLTFLMDGSITPRFGSELLSLTVPFTEPSVKGLQQLPISKALSFSYEEEVMQEYGRSLRVFHSVCQELNQTWIARGAENSKIDFVILKLETEYHQTLRTLRTLAMFSSTSKMYKEVEQKMSRSGKLLQKLKWIKQGGA